MNILYFCQLYAPVLYGGGEYIFYQWARELVKRGHNVFTITQRIKQKGSKDYEEIDGIKIHRVGNPLEYKGHLPPNIKDNAGYLFGAIAKGMELMSKNKIDIIHSNAYSPAFAGQFCSSIFRKPHVITFFDIMLMGKNEVWEKWSNQKEISSFTSIIAPLIERLALSLPATIIHTASKTSMEDISQHVKKTPIVVIPCGVLIEDYEYIPQNQKVSNNLNGPFAVYIGRLVFYKNLQTILRCFDRVIKKIPLAKLVIVGDGPFKKELESEARHLGGNVIFTGRVSHDEKIKLLHESSFFVFPSLVEGFGIVVLEAYAQKKPVLASNVMPLPEIVEEGITGFTIPPFNEEMWARKIIYFFENTKKTQKMGLKGYEKLTQQYTIERIVDQMEITYQDLIKERA